MARRWNPALHPRDRLGRFTRSFARRFKRKDRDRARKVMAAFKPKRGVASGPAATSYLAQILGGRDAGAARRYLAENGFVEVNKILRSGKSSPEVQAIDDAMFELPDDLLVSRRVPLDMFGDAEPDDLVGFVVHDAAFSPASLRMVPAQQGMARLRIAVPKGTRATTNPDTGELILDRDLDLAVASAQPNPAGGWDMHLAVLSKTDTKPGGKAEPDADDDPADTGAPSASDAAAPGPEPDAEPAAPARRSVTADADPFALVSTPASRRSDAIDRAFDRPADADSDKPLSDTEAMARGMAGERRRDALRQVRTALANDAMTDAAKAGVLLRLRPEYLPDLADDERANVRSVLRRVADSDGEDSAVARDMMNRFGLGPDPGRAPDSDRADRPVTFPNLWHVTANQASRDAIRRGGFRIGDGGTDGAAFGRGIYLSADQAGADRYLAGARDAFSDDVVQLAARARVRNPFRVDAGPDDKSGHTLMRQALVDAGLAREGERPSPQEVTDRLKAAGYDSVHVNQPEPNDEIGGSQLLVFDPADLELADGPADRMDLDDILERTGITVDTDTSRAVVDEARQALRDGADPTEVAEQIKLGQNRVSAEIGRLRRAAADTDNPDQSAEFDAQAERERVASDALSSLAAAITQEQEYRADQRGDGPERSTLPASDPRVMSAAEQVVRANGPEHAADILVTGKADLAKVSMLLDPDGESRIDVDAPRTRQALQVARQFWAAAPEDDEQLPAYRRSVEQRLDQLRDEAFQERVAGVPGPGAPPLRHVDEVERDRLTGHAVDALVTARLRARGSAGARRADQAKADLPGLEDRLRELAPDHPLLDTPVRYDEDDASPAAQRGASDPAADSTPAAEGDVPTTGAADVEARRAELAAMKMPALREIAGQLGLRPGTSKAALVDRILDKERGTTSTTAPTTGRDAFRAVPVELGTEGFARGDLDASLAEALDEYRHGNYRDINAHLREGGDDEDFAEVVAGIDSAMDQSRLTNPVLVHRTVDGLGRMLPNVDTERNLVGTEYIDDAYGSTSADRRVADSYGDGGVVLNITVPAGTGAVQLSRFYDGEMVQGVPTARLNPTSLQGIPRPGDFEAELLLERGLTYRITGDRDDNGVRTLDVAVVPGSADRSGPLARGAEVYDQFLPERARLDPAEEARQRQASIDRARAAATVIAEVDELLANGVNNDVLTRGITAAARRSGLPDEQRDRILDAVGDERELRAAVSRLTMDARVAEIARAGDVVPFEPSRHTVIGERPNTGQMVRVVRQGHRYIHGAETVDLDKATVEVATADEVLAARAGSVFGAGPPPADVPPLPAPPADVAVEVEEGRRDRAAAARAGGADTGRGAAGEPDRDGLPGDRDADAGQRADGRADADGGAAGPVTGWARPTDRNADLDQARPASDLLSEVEQLAAAEVDDATLATRTRAALARLGLTGDESPALRNLVSEVDAGPARDGQDRLYRYLRELREERGLEPSGQPGETVPYRQADHSPLSTVDWDAEQVTIVSPGFTLVRPDGERLVVRQAVVGPVAGPAVPNPAGRTRVLDVDAARAELAAMDRQQLHDRAAGLGIGLPVAATDDQIRDRVAMATHPDADPTLPAIMRQNDIDAARHVSGLIRALRQAQRGGADRDGLRRRLTNQLTQRGLAGDESPALSELADAVNGDGDVDQAARRLAAERGISMVDGDDQPFDPDLHDAGGAPMEAGTLVRVVSPGFVLDRNGESIVLDRAGVIPAPASSPADARDRVGAALQSMGVQPGREVALSDLRRDLADVARDDLDAAVLSLRDEGVLDLIPEEDQKRLGPADRDGALQVGRHLVHYAVLRRPPASSAAPSAPARRGGRRATDLSDDRIQGLVDQLTAAPDRDTVRTALAGLNGPTLRELGPRLGMTTLSPRDSVARLRTSVETHLTRSMVSDAIMNAPDNLAARGPSASAVPAPAVLTMSDRDPLPNRWGAGGGPVEYHEDGEIGQAVRSLGPDAQLDIDGESLQNRLALAATRLVRGQQSMQSVLDEMRTLRDRTPPDSRARRVLDMAIGEMDAPTVDMPTSANDAPPALRQLMLDLLDIPLARGSTAGRGRETEVAVLDRLLGSGEFSPQRLASPMRLRMAQDRLRRELTDRRHESTEGRFEIERAVRKAIEALARTVAAATT